MRRLQQADEGPPLAGDEAVIVAVVNTLSELQAALEGGAGHIQLQSHIDATADVLVATEIAGQSFFHLLPRQLGTTHSIVVRPSWTHWPCIRHSYCAAAAASWHARPSDGK